MSTPERALWQAVLEQAYTDAEAPGFGEPEVEPGERTRARRFLRADSAFEEMHLGTVCEFADVPADRVVSWARRRYAAAA